MRQENSGEDGLLAEVIEGVGDKQKIAAKAVKARLKEIGKDPLYADERAALEAYAGLLKQQTEAKAKRKAAQEDLDKKIDAKYPTLTEAEIKTLVVDDKWMGRLSAAVHGELDRVSQTLTGRIRQLAERYATPLPKLTDEVENARRSGRRASQEDGGVMEVRPGYKKTEVGVIPEEWDAKTLASLGSFSKGQGIRKNEAASGDIPCIRYGEIYTHHNDVVRIYNSHMSRGVAQTSKRLAKGDILFAGSGETKEEIGKAVAYVGDDEAYAGGDIVILSPHSESSEFLGYLLNSPVIARQKASKGQGDAVVHISASALGSVVIPLPPVPEQTAIATALSDVDALLGGLDRLIAKKRDLKQAAMQQLLTGQTRPWLSRRVGGEDVGRLLFDLSAGKSKTARRH